MSDEFYIKLLSSNKKDYPENHASSFKSRLPEPIHVSSEWRVALSSIALPDTNKVVPEFALNDEPLFKMKWFVTKKATSEARQFDTSFTQKDISLNFGGLDGVGFMKTVVNFFENQRVTFGDRENVNVFKGWRLRDLVTENFKSYETFQWQPMNELLVNNEQTYKARGYMVSRRLNKVSMRINKHLCHLMKWIVENEDGSYRLGPNLKMELIDVYVKIPDPDLASQRQDIQENVDGNEVAVFFKKVTEEGVDYYHFSFHCNWRFININAAYSNLLESHSRSLIIRSDVCDSSYLGKRKVDVLREVQYKQSGNGVLYIEPTLRQYIPVRKDIIDIVEVKVTEITGDLAQFNGGDTIITLHFKK